jgi:hypothetical protein
MRYKNNVLDKVTQLEIAINRIQAQVSRGIATQDDIHESIEAAKDRLESIREMVSVEPDDFEQQFAPRQ